jgi:CRP-like cAMP-binding protein
VDDAYTHLRHAAARWAPLDDTQWTRLASVFASRELDRREPLVLPGTTRHEVLFVVRGLLRFYYPGEDGKESNKAFIGEGEFAGAIAAANLGLPLLYGVEALEPTLALAAPYTAFTALMDEDAAFERLGRKLAELILTRKELRTRSLLLQNATERYLGLVEARPDLVQRVPQYHLASYLGVSEVHLSRIRSETVQPTAS